MRFRFEALQGDGRAISGQIEAESSRAAYRDLLRRGIQPTAIADAAVSGDRRRRLRLASGRRSRLYILKELHALVGGGVPIADAVAALEEACDEPASAAAYRALHAGLRRGEKFSVAFARAFPSFPVYIQTLIEAGELSGRFAEALADAAAEIEHEARIRTELRNALLYPAFLVSFGLLAVLFIFLVVVPRFAVMFRGKFDQLPWLSWGVIAGGMWLRGHLVLTGIVAIAVAFAVAWLLRQPEARRQALALLTRLPMLRDGFIEIETARWAAVLARLLENRVPLMHSLELARGALRSLDIQLRLGQVERRVRAGEALATALRDIAFLPTTALSLVRVGERSGNLPEMMRSIAQIYDEIVRNRIKAALSIIEPIAIVLIGGAVGLVAVAIFMAITTINKVPGL
jgi:general secretion pathway protein F